MKTERGRDRERERKRERERERERERDVKGDMQSIPSRDIFMFED